MSDSSLKLSPKEIELPNSNLSPTTSSLADFNNSQKSFIAHVFQPPADSSDLIQLPQEMQIYLIGALSHRYLKEVNNHSV